MKIEAKAGDQMDKAMDMLAVALEALGRRDEWVDDDEVIECIRWTVERALSELAPVREFVRLHASDSQAEKTAAVWRLAELFRAA
jgi:hypothetical protein